MTTKSVHSSASPKATLTTDFIPAILALMGTTDDINPWREPLVEMLIQLGADPSTLYDPRVGPNEWDPAIHGPRDDFQKKNAQYMIFYVGNASKDILSVFSSYEIGAVTRERDPDSLCIIIDPSGLEDHHLKQANAMIADLQQELPDLTLVSSVGASLGWIVERLVLQAELGEWAVAVMQRQIDITHNARHTVNPLSPEGLEEKRMAHYAPIAQPIIDRILKAIELHPEPDMLYSLRNFACCMSDTPHDKAIRKFIGRHFDTHYGWNYALVLRNDFSVGPVGAFVVQKCRRNPTNIVDVWSVTHGLE